MDLMYSWLWQRILKLLELETLETWSSHDLVHCCGVGFKLLLQESTHYPGCLEMRCHGITIPYLEVHNWMIIPAVSKWLQTAYIAQVYFLFFGLLVMHGIVSSPFERKSDYSMESFLWESVSDYSMESLLWESVFLYSVMSVL